MFSRVIERDSDMKWVKKLNKYGELINTAI